MTYTSTGRLVLVLDDQLSPESLAAFGNVAASWQDDTVTLLAGVRTHVVQVFGHQWQALFYNAYESLPMHRLLNMLPWREIWLVHGGNVWGITGMQAPLVHGTDYPLQVLAAA